MMTKTTKEHSMEACRFVAEAEEKIIARFIDIAGLRDEYREVTATERGEFRDYALALLMEELHKRGYEISEYHDLLTSLDGVDKGMNWRMVLLHDGKEVAYNTIEIKIGTMRRTGYGVSMR